MAPSLTSSQWPPHSVYSVYLFYPFSHFTPCHSERLGENLTIGLSGSTSGYAHHPRWALVELLRPWLNSLTECYGCKISVISNDREQRFASHSAGGWEVPCQGFNVVGMVKPYCICIALPLAWRAKRGHTQSSEGGGAEENKSTSSEHFMRALGQSAICSRDKIPKKVWKKKKTPFSSLVLNI